jgi:hypothetical protein
MSDNTQAPTNPEAGQPEGGEEQQFLTREEYLAGQEQLLNELKKSNKGLAGSMGETQGKRISSDVREIVRQEFKQLGSLVEAQKAAGVEITPEQENAMKQNIVMNALSAEPEEPKPEEEQAAGGAPAQEPTQQADPISQAAWTMMQERGTDILESDPEFETLDMESPYKFLMSVDAAINAKEQRLAQEGTSKESANENQQGKFARIPGAGAGKTGSSLMPEGASPMDRLSKHYGK